MTIKIKIHNVFHNAEDFSAQRVAERMEAMCTDDRVENIRIAKGNKNSPVFITLSEDTNKLSFKQAKSIASQILHEFETNVSGVDVDSTINDKNLRIENR